MSPKKQAIIRHDIEEDLEFMKELASSLNLVGQSELGMRIATLQASLERSFGAMDQMLKVAIESYSESVEIERKTKRLGFAVDELIKTDPTGLLSQI